MPKSDEMLFKLEFFEYDSSLNLIVGFYHIQLSEDSINLCTIVIPWIKYHYK